MLVICDFIWSFLTTPKLFLHKPLRFTVNSLQMKMALNIELDGFEYLSDSDVTKLSPALKQPPISPIESESSSGISSLDSDDLKKQLLSSPTISHDDEDQQSDGAVASVSGSERGDSRDADDEEEEDEDDEHEQREHDKTQTTTLSEDSLKEVDVEQQESIQVEKAVEVADMPLPAPAPYKPVKVMYQNRDITDLSANLRGSGMLGPFADLPKNNVNFFFQNRAQYWRLSKAGDEHERQTNDIENCPCCDFTYPSTTTHFPQGPSVTNKKPSANAISDSLVCFLKTMEQQYAASSNVNSVSYNAPIANNSSSANNFVGKRNTVAPFPYSMQQQQQQPPNFQHQQSYPPLNNNSGFPSGNNNGSNNNNFGQPPMNPFMNNTNSYGNTLALLNMMNSSCNVNAFRAMNNSSNNAQRFYNNQSSMNGSFGLYKQF